MSELNVVQLKEDTIKALVSSGMSQDEAEKVASKQIDSMGITRVMNGTCPLGKHSPMACMLCSVGHMTECHHPLTCEEAKCSHYQTELSEGD